MNRVKCKINEVKFYSRSIHEILNKLILNHIQTRGGGGWKYRARAIIKPLTIPATFKEKKSLFVCVFV